MSGQRLTSDKLNLLKTEIKNQLNENMAVTAKELHTMFVTDARFGDQVSLRTVQNHLKSLRNVMDKGVAPVKNTGGGGFVFEDYVAAFFMCHILNGRPFFGSGSGRITAIQFQVRPFDWYLDDMLLTISVNNETQHCAFSVKSNIQFTSKQVPEDFVRQVWRQFLGVESTVFKRGQDLLGLITAPLAAKVNSALINLLRKANTQDPSTLPEYLSVKNAATNEERLFFSQFKCPGDLAALYSITEKQTGELLKHLRFRQFDFENNISNDANQAESMCKDILLLPEYARTLWERLLMLAGKYRPTGGYLDLPALLSEIRDLPLRDYPDYRQAWQFLKNYSENNLSVIRDKIGNKVILTRKMEIELLNNAINTTKIVLLNGSSGVGKTVLAKFWAESKKENSRIIWLDASAGHQSIQNMEQNLRYPLPEILASTPNRLSCMIIDGLDRPTGIEVYRSISLYIQALSLDKDVSPWHLIITCQSEEWYRVKNELEKVNALTVKPEIIEIKDPSSQELTTVWMEFPQLKRLIYQSQLQSFLKRPKFLDILARKAVDISTWVGESNLIEWFWNTEVRISQGGAGRAALLMDLAQGQANFLESERAISRLPQAHVHLIEGLVRDQICSTSNERLFFCHDLYGDWARQRFLVSEENGLTEIIGDLLASPIWYRAFRLYGLHLLEHGKIKEWNSQIHSFAKDNNQGNLAQYLLIESILFAANPQPLLETVWSELVANEYLWLKWLLGRFFLSEKPITGWIGLIQSIYRHKECITDLDPKLVSSIFYGWLHNAEEDFPLRKETADMALTIAERVFAERQQNEFVGTDEDSAKVAYRAALVGASEFPDRIAIFVLKASNRDEVTSLKGSISEDGDQSGKKLIFDRVTQTYIELPEPWPDGPSERVDPIFQNICLEGKSSDLEYLILNSPTIAKETILALLIKEPEIHPYWESSPIKDELEIVDPIGWNPPLYTRGPFLFFLQNHPYEGLEIIFRLVNFATERWLDTQEEEAQSYSILTIQLADRTVRWVGDYQVYCWYRGDPHCPTVIASALMAFEKWLYDLSEHGESIESFVQLILQKSSSIAFAGLLNAIGSNFPDIYQKQLDPFLYVLEFHMWEADRRLEQQHYQSGNIAGPIALAAWAIRPIDDQTKFAVEWYTLKHRNFGMDMIALDLFKGNGRIRTFFEQARIKWAELLDKEAYSNIRPAYLERQIQLYNAQNYTVKDDNPEILKSFNPPEEWVATAQQANKAVNDRQLPFQFAIYCSGIITNNTNMDETNVTEFWEAIQTISNISNTSADEDAISYCKSAIYGGITVLFLFQREWLKENAERETWCIEQLVALLEDSSINMFVSTRKLTFC